MEPLFFIQLAASFFVGGSLIALKSLIAERLSAKAAGIVLQLPSTVLVSFFFIALGDSPEAAGKAATLIPLMQGVVLLAITVYIYIARIELSKPVSIFFSLCLSLLAWLLFAFSVTKEGFSNLTLSINVYALSALIAYYLLTIRSHSQAQARGAAGLSSALSQKLFRAFFSGTVVAVSFALAKTLGPTWGGIFSTFPAASISILVAYHKKHGAVFLARAFSNVPLGSLSLVAFGLAGMYAYPKFGAVGGTTAAFGASLVTAFFISRFSGASSETPSS